MDGGLAESLEDHCKLTGVIYIAKLTDTASNLAHYKYMHKLGFATLTREARIKQSIKDITFLQ